MSGSAPNRSAAGATRRRRFPKVPASAICHLSAMSHASRAAGAWILACTLFAPALAQLEPGVDAQVHPGDDFFRFANGAWLQATPIPDGQPRWGARAEIAASTRQQLARLFDDAKAAPPGSDLRRVADFRAAWLDEAAIEARGLVALRPQLRAIAALRDKAGLARWLGRELAADADPVNAGVYDSTHVLGFSLQSGFRGETHYIAYLVQGGLGLPARAAYLDADAASQALRDGYRAALARVLRALDVPAGQADARAAAVLAFETALARSHATAEASADERNADTQWSLQDFSREAPGLDWPAFFAAAGLARQDRFVPWQPGAVKGVAAMVAAEPLAVWRDYLRARAVLRHADVLPRALRAEAPGAAPRAERAQQATEAALSGLIGRLYVQRHFPPAHKARVQAIAGPVIEAFMRRVEAAPWLAPAARATALAKLRALQFGVGYPDRWPDERALMVDATDAIGNRLRVARRERERALARIGRAVDRKAWFIPPQGPGAVLSFNENSYAFAAALLQPPKFEPEAPDAANFGAIGAIVGHEVSHFVDTLGADYEADGRRRNWWSDEDRARYRGVTEALVRQFSAYRPFPEVAVDGQAGLVENLADLGGLAAAFDAHRRALGARVQDAAYVRAQDRLFFIGFARAWRVRYRDDALRAQAATDHAPEAYRVATVRNLDAWYEAFDVRPGHRLYLEPQARVKVW